MKVSLTMCDFPMLFLPMLTEDLEKQGIPVVLQTGGDDTLFVSGEIEDIVKLQILCILCDKYHFAKGLIPATLEGDDTGV